MHVVTTNWKNPDDVRRYYAEYRRQYRIKHPLSVSESNYRKYWKNPEKNRNRTALQRKKMGESVRLMYQQFQYLFNRDRRRKSWKRYYNRTKSYHIKRGAIWARNNKDVVRIRNKNRKYLTKTISGQDCSEKLKQLLRDRFCHWCCIRLNKENRSIDHVTPLSRGGSHSPENLVSSCLSCNCSKGNKSVHEWTWWEAA